MGEAKGVEKRELEYISNGYPRDLLQRLSSSNLEQIRMVKTEEPEEIELNLGLSLGGRFGIDPKESNKLVRSTSIAGLATVLKENDSAAPQQVFHPAGLFRTTSLPTETEEEWRKRKEMQCLRRMEAKRKRSEKQQKSNNNNLKAVSRGSVDEDKRIEVGVGGGGGGGGLMASSTAPPLIPCVPKQQSCMVSNGMFSASVSPPPPVGLASWGGRGSKAIAASFPSPVAGIGGQGSMGSQGSSSTSGISEFDSRPQQGSSNCTEARSPSSVQSVPDQNEKKSSVSPTSTINAETVVPMKVEAAENASKKPKLDNGLRETGMKVMEEMPCVSTKGDGPNGRKIEGFLYKYKKGEEVRIVCVCHGEFLSPAEFVKHAGGGDVAHPLRHIVVNPSPSFL